MKLYTKIHLNSKQILIWFYKILTTLLSILGVVLTLFTLEEIGITKPSYKVGLIILLIIVSLIMSLLLILFVINKSVIWKKGKNQVLISYGDLIKYSFKVKEKEKRIVVIPVNDTFETIVDEVDAEIDKPLVTAKSLHGLWINMMFQYMKLKQEELNTLIRQSLDKQGVKPSFTYSKEEKSRGNLDSYPLGTIAIVNGINNTVFYLLAISKFDENNNARATKLQVRSAVDDLVDFYGKKGQGYPINIPLIGTNFIRNKLNHYQSLKLISSCVLTSEESLNGEINIVIYNKDRDKISIFN